MIRIAARSLVSAALSVALLAGCESSRETHASTETPAAKPPVAAKTPAATAPATTTPATKPAATAPAAKTPTPAAPTGTTPTGTTPTGTTPTGATPTGATPTGATPTGTMPAGAASVPASARTLDPKNFDMSCKPCDDFYKFVNGGWVASNPIPPEYPAWNVFSEVRERNNTVLHQILDEACADKTAAKGSNTQKIGDYYCSCMDEARVEADGIKPLQPELDRIAALKDVAGLQAEIARRHAAGGDALFGFYADQDPGDATRVIAQALQGGLGLPDRDYYTRSDEKSVKLREQYLEHVTKMLGMLGEDAGTAAADAATIMVIETRLANASMTNVELRDPKASYNKMSVADADSKTPGWKWASYLEGVGLKGVNEMNLAQPAFFAAMGQMAGDVPMPEWKAYLRWHLIHEMAPVLNKAVVDENFRFYGTTLAGTPEQLPRWKRCLQRTDNALGEALGQAYVAKAFSPEAKRRAKEMVENLVATFRERLQQLDWMSPETKVQALAKLDAFTRKIGYPDTWRDYSKLEVDRGSFAANYQRAQAFEFRRIMNKVGKPVDRSEWGMSPPTVNAYYNPLMNEIVFPAGIMQPPYFSEFQDDATNYGAMGAVIGHEMTHGFDDEGAQYDAQGNLHDWWAPADLKEFTRRTALVVKEYDDFVAIDDLHVNGKLTLGENIADIGGLTIAYHAYLRSLQGKPEPAPIDGFTGPQRVFLAFAQAWRNNTRPEAMRLQVNTNPHSPGRFRAIGPITNLPEFFAAFGCKDGDPMVRPADQRALIW